jgi:hypothetical protein
LHTISIQDSGTLFPQLFRCESEGNSRLGREEKWRKWGGVVGAAEKEGFLCLPLFSGALFRSERDSAQPL